MFLILQREIEEQRHSIREAKMELKRLLLEAEDTLSQDRRRSKGGKMDSPHAIAQGRGVVEFMRCWLNSGYVIYQVVLS